MCSVMEKSELSIVLVVLVVAIFPLCKEDPLPPTKQPMASSTWELTFPQTKSAVIPPNIKHGQAQTPGTHDIRPHFLRSSNEYPQSSNKLAQLSIYVMLFFLVSSLHSTGCNCAGRTQTMGRSFFVTKVLWNPLKCKSKSSNQILGVCGRPNGMRAVMHVTWNRRIEEWKAHQPCLIWAVVVPFEGLVLSFQFTALAMDCHGVME